MTPETRKKISDKVKAARARETLEQKEARKCKRAENWANKPIAEKRERSLKISKARKNKKEELIIIAKKAYENKSDEAKANSNACLSLAYTSEVRAKISKTKAPVQSHINKKISDSVKANWDIMSPEDKAVRIHSALSNGGKEYELINGTVQWFHSSWEAACADVLLNLGIMFKFQEMFVLGDYNYVADFYLAQCKTIIEVKGRPFAVKRWDEITVPALEKYLDPSIKVFVLRYKPDVKCFGNLNKFLDTMDQLKLGKLLETP